MVQLKYFGDDRDYFKYDLISFILNNKIFSTYCFVPMLTKHRDDAEGDINPIPVPSKSPDLLNFIKSQTSADLDHWGSWLNKYVSHYKTIQPVKNIFFTDQNRQKYWKKYREIIRSEDALIFFDPDTGLQAGRKSKIKKEDKEKYITNDDLHLLISWLSTSSVFVIYQHLQRNKHKHKEDIKQKIESLEEMNAELGISTYYEKDLAFIFLSRDKEILHLVNGYIKDYFDKSTVPDKGLHHNSCSPNNTFHNSSPYSLTMKTTINKCLCCENDIPKTPPRICPICCHEFQGSGWGGMDSHWRREHENDLKMSYEEFKESCCEDHWGKKRKTSKKSSTIIKKNSVSSYDIFQQIISIIGEADEYPDDIIELLRNTPYDNAFSNEISHLLEKKLKTILNKKEGDLFTLLKHAKESDLYKEDAINLGHLIRQQRNIIIHKRMPENSFEARNLLVLISALILLPQLSI